MDITQSERLRGLYEERAAILEYDAGMDREAAEALAREIVYYDKQFGLFDR